MDKITISTFQLFQMFPDKESARVYFESRMWPHGVRCPVCAATENITTRKRVGFYRCNQCHEDFTVCTGTIFERSHIPLRKWLYAMYLLVTARKGISSLQLSKQIGVTQKTAWFMLHRLREACGSDLSKLQGIVEVDDCPNQATLELTGGPYEDTYCSLRCDDCAAPMIEQGSRSRELR
jgi:transposase-like protein